MKALKVLLFIIGFMMITMSGVLLGRQIHRNETQIVSALSLSPYNQDASIASVLPATTAEAPQKKTMEVIDLNDRNTVVMDQAFSDSSVSVVMLKLQELSNKVPRGSTVYLVMNTPGGSVDAGLRLISYARALPLKVKTLTLFAASMGYQTVQQLDERLILDSGTLMSHRAKFGLSGEAPGEFFSRLKWIMSQLDNLDAIAAARMGMSFESYRKLIADEYWVYGENSVNDKAADRTVLAKCGTGLEGTTVTNVETIFGTFAVELSKCPLVPGFISVTAAGQAVNEEVLNYVKTMLSDKKEFVNQYILTNKYQQFQN